MREYINLVEALNDDSNEERLKRAKEMGYDIEDPHYFGTPSGDFDELDLDRTPDEQLAYGRGAYSSRDHEAASGYAQPGTSWGNDIEDAQPTVYKVYLKVKNPFDLDKWYPYPEIKRIYTHCFDIDELKSIEYFMELANEADDYDFIETDEDNEEPDELTELYTDLDDIENGVFDESKLDINPDDYDDGVEDDDYEEDIEHALNIEKKTIQQRIDWIEKRKKEDLINHKKMLNNGRKAASIGKDIYKNLWKNTTEYHDYGIESMLFGGDTGTFEYKTQANRWLEELGYDGIRHIDYYNPGKRGQSHEVTIAFNPNQVKSVHAQFRNDNSKLSENHTR